MDNEERGGGNMASLSIRMLAMQEAFADPFQQGNQSLMDSGHLKELDPRGVSASAELRKARKALFQPKLAVFSRRPGKENGGGANAAGCSGVNVANAKDESGYDPDKVFRKNPGFDPVFMKI